MSTFQGQRVSHSWALVLNEAWRQGVRFQINSGQRTMADQQHMVDTKGLYNSATNPHGAAAPSATAPHVRVGHENHAIDVDTFAYGGGEQHLQDWLNKHGVQAVNDVSTEAWHIDPVNESQLVALAHKIDALNKDRERYPTIKKGGGKNTRAAVKRLQHYLRAVGYKSVKETGKFDAKTRAAVLRFKKAHPALKGGGNEVAKPTWQMLEKVMRGGK